MAITIGGNALAKAGDLDAAIEAYDQALETSVRDGRCSGQPRSD